MKNVSLYLLAVLTLCSPLVAIAMVVLSAGLVGVVQRQIVVQLMLESDLQALADAEAKTDAAVSNIHPC